MASINSVTGSLSSTSSLRGYGGLASGLDRDTLIEQLTYGTRTKIEKQKQKSDKLEWQQTALRSIIDKGYNFTNTYTSYGSTATNLTSNLLFSRTNITATGDNSKYVSVSGNASTSDLFSITGVKQLASNAKISGSTGISTNQLMTGAIDFSTPIEENLVAGKEISFKYGDQTIYAKIEADASLDFNKPEDLAKALNKAFEKTEVQIDQEGTTKKLSELLSAGTYDDGGTTKLSLTSKGGGGNTFEITGGTNDLLERLGFLGEGEKLEQHIDLGTAGTEVKAKNAASAMKETSVTEMLAGKTMTFEYNGVKKEITLSSNIGSVTDLKNELQKGLDSAFGKKRIEVSTSGNRLVFKTKDAATGGEDTTSTLSITGAGSGLLGAKGVFGISANASNRVNLNAKILESGLALSKDQRTTLEAGGELELKINDATIKITKDSTVQGVMDAINKSDADVKISYQKNSDRFVMTSNQKGASGKVDVSGDFATALFGSAELSNTGKDAVIAVQYAGEDEPTLISRDSNSFTLDGLTVNVKKAFGYDDSGKAIADTDPITFEASVDVENTTKVVKDMINDFNAILEQVNKELKTKPNKDQNMPLTASQKEDMSESEIKEWEEAAKTGILYGDADLRRFANDLRFILPSADRQALEEIGISVSSNYADNGKLVFDETKFKTALETNPEKVEELFTRKAGTDADGNKVSSGLMENIKNVMDRYTGTIGATKGALVQRAGSEHSPLSLLQNTMKTQMDSISDYIDRLLDRLETEENRYISQFTALESLISQMNSQSSYLSQLSGGY